MEGHHPCPLGPLTEAISRRQAPITCGSCWYCQHDLWSLCDNTNPNAELQEAVLGYPTAGIYGYTHTFGGYAGGHARYVRVPHADSDCFIVPEGLRDEQVLFLSDAAPTGYMGAEFCNIHPGDTVAVFGAGGVGLMAMESAFLLGAGRVIAIDRFPERPRHAPLLPGGRPQGLRDFQEEGGRLRAGGVHPVLSLPRGPPSAPRP